MSSVKFIPASGKCESGLCIVGEAGGETEDREGRPFCGRAGKLLDKMLDHIGLNRENVYVTNVVKIRPTQLPLDTTSGIYSNITMIKFQNRTPTDEELESWKPLLIKEIKEIKPKVILALGACATKTLLGEKFTNMTTVRGNVFTLKNGIKVVPSWHPAYLLRKSGDKIINEQVKNDLKLVQKLLNT